MIDEEIFLEVEKEKYKQLKLERIKLEAQYNEAIQQKMELEQVFPNAAQGSRVRSELHVKRVAIQKEIDLLKLALRKNQLHIDSLREYPRLIAFIKAAKRRLSVEDWKLAWEEVEQLFNT